MSVESTRSSGGIGCIGMVTTALVVLKVTGWIHWSWLWILAPIWGTAAVIILVVLAMIVIFKRE